MYALGITHSLLLVRNTAIDLLSLPPPPCRWRITRRNRRPPQRHQMAPLVRIAGHLRAVLAAHVALKLMDRRRLRAPNDVQGDRLVGIAAEAPDFKIKVAHVERVAQGRATAVPIP